MDAMKIVIFPAVDDRRFTRIAEAAGSMTALNCDSEETALSEIFEADAFFGKLTAPLLRVAKKLRWVQSPTASLEHYIFRELVEHPCILTNMRGLYSDVIAPGFVPTAFTNPIYVEVDGNTRFDAPGLPPAPDENGSALWWLLPVLALASVWLWRRRQT